MSRHGPCARGSTIPVGETDFRHETVEVQIVMNAAKSHCPAWLCKMGTFQWGNSDSAVQRELPHVTQPGSDRVL